MSSCRNSAQSHCKSSIPPRLSFGNRYQRKRSERTQSQGASCASLASDTVTGIDGGIDASSAKTGRENALSEQAIQNDNVGPGSWPAFGVNTASSVSLLTLDQRE